MRLFPSAHSLARSGCRLTHFTDHISQCCSHQQSIHLHKHLPRRSLPQTVAEALQLKFEIDQRNQWPVTRSTFNSSQRPLVLSELPCFTHRASQTPGDTDIVGPRCLRDHCFRSYVRLSAGSTGGRLRAQKTSRPFLPSGFSLWLAVAPAYNDDGQFEIFFAGFPLFFSKFLQSGQLLGERWGELGMWRASARRT